MRPCALALLLGLPVLCPAAGCAIPLRLAVGPTVDTMGVVGFEAKISAGLELVEGKDDQIQLGVHATVGGGVLGSDHIGSLVMQGELSSLFIFGVPALRLGILGGGRFLWDRRFPDVLPLGSFGMNFAALFAVHEFSSTSSTDKTLRIGPQLQAEVLWPLSQSASLSIGSAIGFFSLPFVLEFDVRIMSLK